MEIGASYRIERNQSVNLRIKPASGLRVRTTHPRPRNSHVPFHHPLHSLLGEDDEKEHAHWSQHLRRNGWVIRTRKLVGENNPQNDNQRLQQNGFRFGLVLKLGLLLCCVHGRARQSNLNIKAHELCH